MAHTSQRIAFSFSPGIFDIKRMQPAFWDCDEESGSAHVQLSARWHRLLPMLSHCNLMMACAPAGPVTAAVAVPRLRFEPVPDSSEWVCLESGIELCPANLGGVLAALEPLHGGQYAASLQFFDRSGEGCLKLMLTNRSDLSAFEHLVLKHATPQYVARFAQSGAAPTAAPKEKPDAHSVRRLWNGLRRTLPMNTFPGLEGVSRRSALAAAGPEHAWRVREDAVLPLIRAMTLADAPLGLGVRNDATFLPAGLYPAHWADCCCGTTFFASTTQVTLRHEINESEVWAVRFMVNGEEILSVEVYDCCGSFRAGLGLRHEAHALHRQQWNYWLREGAC